jgi:alcohol dehydrogenase, propanol-preferring
MLAARMHGYDQPLILEDIRIPEIRSNEVLVKVGGTGMCRSDVQLIDGYFRAAKEYDLPITLRSPGGWMRSATMFHRRRC